MPPKTATDGASKDNSSKTFSFDDVAYLVAKLDAAKIGLRNKDYQTMAKLNGTRSEHGYQHLFREVKARGREIVPMINDGDASAIKASQAKSPASGKAKAGGNGEKNGAKRGRKARSEENQEDDEEGEVNKKAKTEDADGDGDADAPAGDIDFD